MKTDNRGFLAFSLVPYLFTMLAPFRGAAIINILTIGLLSCLSLFSYAQERIESDQASLIYHSGDGEEHVSLPLTTQVEMKVSGWTNRVNVRQVFRNDTQHWLNGRYQFPLPDEAAVDHMRLEVGSKVIEGQIKEKLKAKKQFEMAKKTGKRASLVSQSTPNIFTTSVANLGPGEALVVEISYQELVSYKKGEFSLRFPMVVNPRYFSPLSMQEQKSRSVSFSNTLATIENGTAFNDHIGIDAAAKVSIEVELDAGVELGLISSPYHKISRTQLSGSHYRVSLTGVKADRDFVLNWRPQLDTKPVAAVFSQQGKTHSLSSKAQVEPMDSKASTKADSNKAVEDDYALLMLLPPSAQKQDVSISRELILVIDTSGSMSGASIAQAKRALNYALAGLKAKDTFNVIEFNSNVGSLSPYSLPATAKNIGLANQYVRSLKANGGTEMQLALNAALDKSTETEELGSERLRQVLFMTDGSVGDEQSLFHLIKQKIGESRLFTLGIGSAPNSHFMRRAAEFGRGTFTYIGKLDEVQSKIESLLYQIERPQLTDIKLRYSDNRVPDYWPAVIPDLYAEEPLLVSIKMNSTQHVSSPTELIVSGTIGGQYWQESVSLKERKPELGLDLIWARKQLAALELSKNGVNEQRVKQQITALALDYHLVSAHTSLVAVEMTPARASGITSKSVELLSAIPFGWVPPATLPQTGTASRLFILIGGLLLSLLGIYLLSYYRAFGLVFSPQERRDA